MATLSSKLSFVRTSPGPESLINMIGKPRAVYASPVGSRCRCSACCSDHAWKSGVPEAVEAELRV